MPYKTKQDFSESVCDDLPAHALEIYKQALNSAWQHYEDPAERQDNTSQEELAYSVAWAAVKRKYEKNEKGKWIKRKDTPE